MRKIILLLVLLVLCSVAQGQTSSHTAFRVRQGSALPTTCSESDIFYKNDTNVFYGCTAAPNTWTAFAAGAGAGTVTNTGALTANKLLKGNGGVDLTPSKVGITDPTTAATLIFGTDNASITFQGTDTYIGRATTDTLTNKTLTSPVVNSPTGIVKGDVGLGSVDNTSDATKDAAASALTNKTGFNGLVITANTGSITIGAWNGTVIAFGKGGTGLTTAADDEVIVSSGSAWVAKAIPDCVDTGGNHLNYTASSNSFSCGTSGGGGGGLTIGTSTIASGTTTRVLFDNAGVLGEYVISGTGNVAMTDSPVFTTQITSPIVLGGSSSGGHLLLKPTSHATQGYIQIGGTTSSFVGLRSDVVGETTLTVGRADDSAYANIRAAKWQDGPTGARFYNTGGVFIAVNNAESAYIPFRGSTFEIMGPANTTLDTMLGRAAAANIRHGDADAAAPVAQTISVQNVVTGTTNTAGANWTFAGSQSTGTGAGGSIIFKTSPAGSTGTAVNALSTALTIASDLSATFAGTIVGLQGAIATPAFAVVTDPTIGWYSGGTNDFSIITGAGNTRFAFQPHLFYILSDSAQINFGAGIDTGLKRVSAGVLEINNTTAGQWGALKSGVRDAGTTTITNGLTIGHQSTGTPAAGLGSAILFNINSTTTADQNAARIAALWTTATHASRTADLVFYTVNNAAALTEAARITAVGDFSLLGKATTYNNVATAGLGVPVIRAATHLSGQTAAVASVATYTPAVDTTVDVSVSLLITTSSGENFTITVSYTDTGSTARVATLPLRLLTGANVLIVNSANGAIPYAGVLQQFRAKGGTSVTIATTGTFTGVTYNMSAMIMETQQ